MRRVLGAAAVAALAAAMWVTPAMADGGVDKRGPCSAGRSEWRLRADPNNGNLEVRFKVNQHRPSDAPWTVVITQNGVVVFDGQRVGQGNDGEFEIRRNLRDERGRDTIAARATNQRNGVTCAGEIRV